MAVGSPDLLTWTKAPENPVIAAPPAGVDVTAYRDHCVWREGSSWRQLVGSGIRGRGGTAFLYESADLRTWDYIGPLFIGDASAGDPAATDWEGTMWECVDLFRAGPGSLGDGGGPADDVLVFSAWDDGDTRHPLYWTGRYSGDSFEPAALHRLDYGGRYFYAPQSFIDDAGRRVMFGWLQEGRTDEAMVEAGWSGVMSLPRVATLDAEGELAFAPVPEVEKLRRDHVRLGPQGVAGSEVLAEVAGNQLDLELDVELEPGSVFRLGILGSSADSGAALEGTAPGSAEETVIEVSRGTGGDSWLRLDRSRSSLDSLGGCGGEIRPRDPCRWSASPPGPGGPLGRGDLRQRQTPDRPGVSHPRRDLSAACRRRVGPAPAAGRLADGRNLQRSAPAVSLTTCIDCSVPALLGLRSGPAELRCT